MHGLFLSQARAFIRVESDQDCDKDQLESPVSGLCPASSPVSSLQLLLLSLHFARDSQNLRFAVPRSIHASLVRTNEVDTPIAVAESLYCISELA